MRRQRPDTLGRASAKALKGIRWQLRLFPPRLFSPQLPARESLPPCFSAPPYSSPLSEPDFPRERGGPMHRDPASRLAVTAGHGSPPTAKALGPGFPGGSYLGQTRLAAIAIPPHTHTHTHRSQSRRLSWPWPRCPWPGGAGLGLGPRGGGVLPAQTVQAAGGSGWAQPGPIPPSPADPVLPPPPLPLAAVAVQAPPRPRMLLATQLRSPSLTGLVGMARAVIGPQIVTGSSYTVASFLRKRAGLKRLLSYDWLSDDIETRPFPGDPLVGWAGEMRVSADRSGSRDCPCSKV